MIDKPSVEVIVENIPEQLKEYKAWILWKPVWDNEKQKWDKPPRNPHSPEENGSSTNPTHWVSFEDILLVKKNNPEYGIGFVLSPSTGIVGLDFDKCLDDAGECIRHEAWIKRIESYVEKSPSGKGIRSFVLGKLNWPSGINNQTLGIEIYEEKRFLTITGDMVSGAKLVEEQGLVNDLVSYVRPSEESSNTTMSSTSPEMTDDEIIEKLGHAKNATKFYNLWNGDNLEFDSTSEGDGSLILMIKFYTQDPVQIRRIMLSSGRVRDKWSTRRGGKDYLDYIIQKSKDLGVTYSKTKPPTPTKNDFQYEVEAPQFILDRGGKPLSNLLENHELALRNLQRDLGIIIWHDEFSDRDRIDGFPPFGPYLEDAAVTRLRFLINETYGWLPTKGLFTDFIEDYAGKNRFHPVKEWLASLNWDGIPRLDTWLIQSAGAEDIPYVRAVSSLILLAAVRRVRQPGCKFDEMLVLESNQGGDKSTALRKLAVFDEWFIDEVPLDTKKAMEVLTGKWIAESAELKGMYRKEISDLKAFLSRQEDTCRMAYDRFVKTKPRQCVFLGSTNDSSYLMDPTGGRRFWPISIKPFDLNWIEENREQLWAEAEWREREGESIRLDPSLWESAALEQEGRRQEDPWEEVFEQELSGMDKVFASTLWDVLEMPPNRREVKHRKRLGETMTALGWKRERETSGERRYFYVRQ